MRRLLVGGLMITCLSIPFLDKPQSAHLRSECVEFKNARNIYDEYLIKYEEVERQKEIQRQIEEQERLRLEELERQRIEGESKKEWIEFELTFYTSLPSENGGYTVTCLRENLKYGMVANNVFDLGTKIYLENWGTFTNSDRGGSNFNSLNRLDVLIERNYGESDSEYYNRVNNMGKVKVMGYIIK